jgi:hypothetical protein
MYIVDQVEHGNCGVCRYDVLEKLPLKEALRKTPYDYFGVMPKMWGFYPMLCSTKNFRNPSYIWNDDDSFWEKVKKNKKVKK